MATLDTKLYATKDNGGSPDVSVQEIVALAAAGVQAGAVANCVPATDGTSAGTQLNALLVSLRASGLLAS